MKMLKDFFARIVCCEEPEDVMKIADAIGPLIEEAVWDVFVNHRMELLSEPITFVVPAVWGAKKDGELTASQKAINGQVTPVIDKIIAALDIKCLKPSQEFAINYLIRGLIVSKITYMIEALRSRLKERSLDEQTLNEALLRFKPHGTA